MKALTISQPYASLIVSGKKWVENRTWGTSYRGMLAIHLTCAWPGCGCRAGRCSHRIGGSDGCFDL